MANSISKIRMALSKAIAPKISKGVGGSNSGMSFIMPNYRNPPVFGTSGLLDAYKTMPWLRAITGKIGQAVGTTRWKLYSGKDPATGKTIDPLRWKYLPANVRNKKIENAISNGDGLQEILMHPLLTLLINGNENMVGQSVFQVTQQHMDLVGEAYWVLERNALKAPIAIWPVPPDWVTELPTVEKPYYTIKTEKKNTEVPVTEVIRFVDLDPSNPYGRGTGVSKALGDELETDEYAVQHLKAFFYNRARPDIIISGDNLKREDVLRLEEKWLEKHQGFWNRFKPHFINRSIEVQEIGQSFEEMQIVALRKAERDTIMQTFAIPPEKLGLLTASNRSTIAAADSFWQRDVLLPRIELIRNTLQKHLVPMFDTRLILDFESPVIDDKEYILDVMKASPSSFTRNEWRKAANLDPLPRGEAFIMRPGEIEVDANGAVGEGLEANLPAPAASAPAKSKEQGLLVHTIRNEISSILDEELGKISNGGSKLIDFTGK